MKKLLIALAILNFANPANAKCMGTVKKTGEKVVILVMHFNFKTKKIDYCGEGDETTCHWSNEIKLHNCSVIPGSQVNSMGGSGSAVNLK